MDTRTGHFLQAGTGCFASLLLALSLCVPVSPAYAASSAEKQAEADGVMQQIDVLQTALNQANDEYRDAVARHDEAIALRDEAQGRIDEQNSRISNLQDRLADCAAGMYKTGGASSFIDVLLGAASFEEFLISWDAVNTISGRGAQLVQQTKDARTDQESARATYQEQGGRAEAEMESAQQTQVRIAATQDELRNQAALISTEVAELQAQEELQAEAARQAAEATAAAGSGGSSSAGGNVVSGNGMLANPCPGGSLSSGFGYRDFDSSFHKGIDLAAPEGTPYYAAADGTVVYATYDGGWNGGAGNWIVITHGNGLVTKYMHSSAVYVRAGQAVTRGQNIGAVGNTGDSFGAHLHFQVEANGVAVNPFSYL
jgi:murein DD-endopeptidase MepM/ murein hydrolase activator NlpD